MTDLCKAAEMALEALKETIALCINYKSVEDTDGYQFTEANDVIKQGESAHNALRQALSQPDPFDRLIRIMGTFDLSTGHADNWTDLLDSLEFELRDVLGYYREMFKAEPKCSSHPDAPHGFNRDASHSIGRYVCDCEGWTPDDMAYRPGGLSMDEE